MSLDSCAKFADLFASRASNVMIFFAYLFGLRAVYNNPGTVDESNWRLRLSADWLSQYERRREAGDALDLPSALSTAIRARGPAVASAHRDSPIRLWSLPGRWFRWHW